MVSMSVRISSPFLYFFYFFIAAYTAYPLQRRAARRKYKCSEQPTSQTKTCSRIHTMSCLSPYGHGATNLPQALFPFPQSVRGSRSKHIRYRGVSPGHLPDRNLSRAMPTAPWCAGHTHTHLQTTRGPTAFTIVPPPQAPLTSAVQGAKLP